MATTFGTRPEDTVADSRGNVVSGVAINLYPTEADATARTSLVASVQSDTHGLWPFSDAGERAQLWARDPAGRVWPVTSNEAFALSGAGVLAAATAAQAAAESAADSAAAAATLVNAPADTAMAAVVGNPASATAVSLSSTIAAAVGDEADRADAAITAAVAPKADLATLDPKAGTARNAAALRPFRAALALRESAPVDIYFIGHSLIEGEGATAQTQRGTDRLRDILRTRFPVTGVPGGYGFQHFRTLSTTWAMTRATVSGGSNNGAYGLGAGARFVNASGAFMRLESVVCTAVDVLYVQGGGGTFSTKVDGVANGDSKVTTGAPVQLMKYRVPGISGAAAAHTVQADWVSGNAILLGFMVYNGDETKGIRVWNSGGGGFTSTVMVDTANVKDCDLATIAPQLVSITCFANDYKTQMPLATSRANLVSIVNAARAKAPNASIVFSIEHALGNVGVPTIPWSDYAALYYDVADQFGDIAVFDMDSRLSPDHTKPTLPGVIVADQQHYSDGGYLMWADALAKFLEP